MSKIEYAKFQFMIIVLRALAMLLIDSVEANLLRRGLVQMIDDHIRHLQFMMEEK